MPKRGGLWVRWNINTSKSKHYKNKKKRQKIVAFFLYSGTEYFILDFILHHFTSLSFEILYCKWFHPIKPTSQKKSKKNKPSPVPSPSNYIYPTFEQKNEPMGNARFILKEPESKDKTKEPKSKEATLIFMLFSYDNKKLKYSTGIKILHKYWNSGEQRAREVKDFMLILKRGKD